MNLVLQGAALSPPLSKDAISELVALTGANHVVTLGPCAWRLTGVTEQPQVQAWCAHRGLDFAWLPDERRLADLRLLALDMDSTLITIEGIDEMGDLLGIRQRIAMVTAAAMRGEIDYPESLRRRVALLARCRQQGIRTLLVSGGFSFFTQHLKELLQIDFTLSNELEIAGGRLTGRLLGDLVDGAAKAAKLVAVRNELGISRAQTLAVGDGANDIPMMREAGLSVAYRAKAVVREHATHVLDYAQLDGVLNLFL